MVPWGLRPARPLDARHHATGRNTDEPAVARTADGFLHVVALERASDPALIGLAHYVLDTAGALQDGRTAVLDGWRPSATRGCWWTATRSASW